MHPAPQQPLSKLLARLTSLYQAVATAFTARGAVSAAQSRLGTLLNPGQFNIFLLYREPSAAPSIWGYAVHSLGKNLLHSELFLKRPPYVHRTLESLAENQ